MGYPASNPQPKPHFGCFTIVWFGRAVVPVFHVDHCISRGPAQSVTNKSNQISDATIQSGNSTAVLYFLKLFPATSAPPLYIPVTFSGFPLCMSNPLLYAHEPRYFPPLPPSAVPRSMRIEGLKTRARRRGRICLSVRNGFRYNLILALTHLSLQAWAPKKSRRPSNRSYQ
jgi:hypothetical protein